MNGWQVAAALSSLLATISLAVVRMLWTKVDVLRDQVTMHEVTLFGAHGANGLSGDVKALREKTHRQSNEIQGLKR